LDAAENKATMRRIMEHVIDEKDLDAADELFSEEHELHPGAPGHRRTGHVARDGLHALAAGRAVESWEIIDTGRSPDAPPW
jgi:hypothetical protein